MTLLAAAPALLVTGALTLQRPPLAGVGDAVALAAGLLVVTAWSARVYGGLA